MVNTDSTTLSLQFGMTIADLYSRDGLVKLDQAFLDFLKEGESSLHQKLAYARAHPDELPPKDESALLIEIAPWLEDFIAKLFGIETEVKALAERHHELASSRRRTERTTGTPPTPGARWAPALSRAATARSGFPCSGRATKLCSPPGAPTTGAPGGRASASTPPADPAQSSDISR